MKTRKDFFAKTHIPQPEHASAKDPIGPVFYALLIIGFLCAVAASWFDLFK